MTAVLPGPAAVKPTNGSSQVFDYINLYNAVRNDRDLLYASGSISNQSVDFLIDSGASANFIS